MVISKRLKETLKNISEGQVFSIQDFDIPMEYQLALVKALGRLVLTVPYGKFPKGNTINPDRPYSIH